MQPNQSTIGDRVRAVLLNGWFTTMMLRHYGKDYGSERVNQYAFYRRMHGMTASEALFQCNRWRKAFKEGEQQ